MAFLQCGSFRLSLARPLVMGIVNVTPDSFSDGGQHALTAAAVEHALQLRDEGADILDIGGESTRPGALPVSVDEELRRVVPVFEALRCQDVPLSADTCKPEVMRAAIAAGVSMINDITALQSPEALEAVAAANVAVCLMHKQGEPQTMQSDPRYQDVVAEVIGFLRARAAAAEAAGIAPERLVVDPGFGFGKTLEHNILLLRRLDRLAAVGLPVLAGLSRKSMLGMMTDLAVGERLAPSMAAAVLAVMKGARIVRVHDVKATVQALQIVHAVEGGHG